MLETQLYCWPTRCYSCLSIRRNLTEWSDGGQTVSSINPNTDALDKIVLSMKFSIYVKNKSGMSRQSILRTMRRMRAASFGVPPSRAVPVCGDDMFGSMDSACSKGVFSPGTEEGSMIHDIVVNMHIEIRKSPNRSQSSSHTTRQAKVDDLPG